MSFFVNNVKMGDFDAKIFFKKSVDNLKHLLYNLNR